MATAYITDRAHLVQLLGSATVDKAEKTLGIVELAPVIASQNALADGYVLAQTTSALTQAAIEQVSYLVAELVLTALYINNGNEQLTKRREAAIKSLRDIASGSFRLATAPVADDPATTEDESQDLRFGSAPRQMDRTALGYGSGAGEDTGGFD